MTSCIDRTGLSFAFAGGFFCQNCFFLVKKLGPSMIPSHLDRRFLSSREVPSRRYLCCFYFSRGVWAGNQLTSSLLTPCVDYSFQKSVCTPSAHRWLVGGWWLRIGKEKACLSLSNTFVELRGSCFVFFLQVYGCYRGLSLSSLSLIPLWSPPHTISSLTWRWRRPTTG